MFCQVDKDHVKDTAGIKERSSHRLFLLGHLCAGCQDALSCTAVT